LKKLKFFISNIPPVKELAISMPLKGGRNFSGKYVFRCRGGGISKNYRVIDFLKLLWELPFFILRNEYDPFRTSFISLLCYCNGILSYTLSVQNVKSKQRYYATNHYMNFLYGNIFLLKNVPEGTFINCVEDFSNSGGKIARAAGTVAILLKKFSFNKILIRLPSKEEIFLSGNCLCTLGRVSNPNHRFRKLYKAGQNRLLNIKPIVRGVAKNPVDHPHGGGGGRCLVTAWAKIAKTKMTRRKITFHRNEIVFSRKKRKRKLENIKDR